MRYPGGALARRLKYIDTGSDVIVATDRTYHFDGLGSTKALTDQNRVVTDEYSYNDWGVVTRTGPSGVPATQDNPYQYVGELGYYTHYQEPTLGLLQVGVRYYDPQTGRFTQLDPIGDGVNWYGYAGGNPVNAVDPWGLKPRAWYTEALIGAGQALLDNAVGTVELVVLLQVNQTTGGLVSRSLAQKSAAATVATYQREGAGGVVKAGIKGGTAIVEGMFPRDTLSNPRSAGYSATNAILILAPLAKGGKAAKVLKAGDIGSWNELRAARVPGSTVTPHHMPQAAAEMTSRSEGLCIAVEHDEHVLTRTYKARGRQTLAKDAGLGLRPRLTRDIRDLKKVTGRKYNKSLMRLIDEYRKRFPDLMKK